MEYRRLAITGAILAGAVTAIDPLLAKHALAHEAVVDPERHELSLPRTPEYNYDPPIPGSYALPSIKHAADGRVLDETGGTQNLRELFRDKITVMAFIYTRCGDVCPKAMMLLHELGAIAGEDVGLQRALRLVTISFDPEHDTPEVMAREAAAWRGPGRNGEWRFLTTNSSTELRPILDAYDQPVGRKADASDPLGPLAHQLRVYLIDAGGEIRNIYSAEFLDPRLVIGDVLTLLEKGPTGAVENAGSHMNHGANATEFTSVVTLPREVHHHK